MLAAGRGRLNILTSWWNHDPTLRNARGETVAMFAAYRGELTQISR